MMRWPTSRYTWLAWALCGLIALGAGTNLAWQLANAQGQDALTLAGIAVWTALPLIFALPGTLIIARQPGNAIGWLLLGPALLGALPSEGYLSSFAGAPADPSFVLLLNLWLQSWGWLLLIVPVVFIPLLFPTGRPLSPRWRWVIALGLGMSAFLIFLATFTLDLSYQDQWSVANPIGFIAHDPFASPTFSALWSGGLLVLTVLCVGSLFVRYRRAGRLERQQIKWLLYACALFAGFYSPSLFVSEQSSRWALLVGVLLPLTILIIPIAIALAILRYRLYDIDVIIRKTLVYAVLTALLGLVYAGSVILLQQLFEAISGQQSPLAIVLSTLAIAALFSPLRRRVQNAVDRRFYRGKVDAAQALAAFAIAARDETDLDALVARLVGVTQETMQPDGVSLWLKR